ncbi:MAG TPA: chromate efflux transporter [Solirubrobacteraceae bacterium]|nr:chromate efflux transporter [Solirubrobacteraceae bacterium]
MPESAAARVPLRTVAREWTRIGATGFGGPPAHIELLRRLVVDREHWVTPAELEDAIAACNLLPGPASTQLAIYLARRVAGPPGAIVGGLCFVTPAVVVILALSALFLSQSPPTWARGAGAGAGSAVAAVAVAAGIGLARPSWRRAGKDGGRRIRWLAYALLGGAGAALIGPLLVLVLVGCGVVELTLSTRGGATSPRAWAPVIPLGAVTVGGVGALAWVALKVGALSFGGGFVIVPLMQRDAVHTYHWMTGTAFLNAVALGQVTPGPLVATVAAVGYAAHGLGGGVLAAVIAFAPSFLIVLLAGGYFDRLRTDRRAQAFLDGAGPAAIGAILGSAIPLTGALVETWQFIVLGAAAVALLLLRRGVVLTLVGAGVVGVIVALAGGPLPG